MQRLIIIITCSLSLSILGNPFFRKKYAVKRDGNESQSLQTSADSSVFALIKRLQTNTDPMVAQQLAEYLGHKASEKEVTDLQKALNKTADPAVVAALVDQLETSTDETVVMKLSGLLTKVKDPVVVQKLVDRLAITVNKSKVKMLIQILTKQVDRTVVAELVNKITVVPDFTQVANLVKALVRMPDQLVVAKLAVRLVVTVDPSVVLKLAQALTTKVALTDQDLLEHFANIPESELSNDGRGILEVLVRKADIPKAMAREIKKYSNGSDLIATQRSELNWDQQDIVMIGGGFRGVLEDFESSDETKSIIITNLGKTDVNIRSLTLEHSRLNLVQNNCDGVLVGQSSCEVQLGTFKDRGRYFDQMSLEVSGSEGPQKLTFPVKFKVH